MIIPESPERSVSPSCTNASCRRCVVSGARIPDGKEVLTEDRKSSGMRSCAHNFFQRTERKALGVIFSKIELRTKSSEHNLGSMQPRELDISISQGVAVHGMLFENERRSFLAVHSECVAQLCFRCIAMEGKLS